MQRFAQPFQEASRKQYQGFNQRFLVERSVHNVQKGTTKEIFYEVNCVIKFTEIFYIVYHFEQTKETLNILLILIIFYYAM